MSGFNLQDYVTVSERLTAFYDKYPDGSIQCDIVELNERRVVMRATVYRTATDERPSVAHSSLTIPGKTPYTAGSEIENAETSAAGRAIAFMGFEVKRGVASREEVEGKQDGGLVNPQPDRSNGGVIGKLVAQGTQDFALRQTPDGHALPFRVKEGNKSQIVIAHDAMAVALDAVRDVALDARVTVFGTFTDETLVKAGRTIEYQVLHLTRIVGPDFTIPGEEAPTAPLFDADELADISA